MLAFKVVDKETRYGSNVAMWRQKPMTSQGRCYSPKEIDNYIIDNCLQKWTLKYDIGAELECVPGSPGIMCFYTRKDAEDFISEEFIVENILHNTTIIKVEGKDLMHCDMFIGKHGCGSCLWRLKDNDGDYDNVLTYKGLVTFKKVTVLD